MRCPFKHFTVGLVTFLIGLGLASVWIADRQESRVLDSVIKIEVERFDIATVPTDASGVTPAEGELMTVEERAVRTAEEFIARNGYTDLPPEKDKLSYESIEWEGSVDELLKLRHNTLERKAYGVLHAGRLETQGGWMVVFRYKGPFDNLGDDEGFPMHKRGRAVTMDKEFTNLRVEHKDVNLDKVHKKLELAR